MIRKTSLEAYNTIKENGLLSARRWETYDALFHFGPATATELVEKMRIDQKSPVLTGNTCSRLNELRDMGIIYEKQERKCRITGFQVIEWDVTDKLPKKVIKPKKIKCRHCNGKGYFIQENLL